MTGPVTRKLEIAKQIEEARQTLSEAPPGGATRAIADDRLARRRAILSTLVWNQDHEHLIRAWLAERRGDGVQFRIKGGQFCWASGVDGYQVWTPFTTDEANGILARLDAPAKGEGA